ncbi:MAG: PfkB family carbohydrate kinase [Candidatus Thermoplasmatota archaeon]|nr:PfkB family carbohydrate kinase [Candidatus Thermoplasmatota archaeon]
MDVLIVGSLAYDSLETPAGSVENELGGSASYGGFSAAFHNNKNAGNGVGIVGVIGQDFQPEHLEWYKNAGLDTSGIEVNQGETFRWKGSYHGSMAEAVTHETHLNVFENFQPKVPQPLKQTKVLMCANLHPALQSSVLSQTEVSRVSILDSMNLWIEIANGELKDVMKQVDILILNDGEVRMLADEENLIVAAKTVLEMKNGGILVVKKGENGVIAFHPDGMISMPSFPTSNLVDPTGCGDSFAGSMAHYLSKNSGEVSREELAESLVHATVTASFTIENFGTERIRRLSAEEYESRLLEYRSITKTS